MARKSSTSTAVVKGGYLYTANEATTGTKIDSPEWVKWLETGETFYFDDERAGSFTARAEKRRQGLSWYAFRKVNGKLIKRYIGRNAALTANKLMEIAASFNI